MEQKPEFPYLAVVVSGGHTLLLLVEDFTKIIKLGSTVDDAAGEAFDKVAKMLGMGYPGGPKIQEASLSGDRNKIDFPVADLKGPYNFSFSGLKTSVLRYIQKNFPGRNIPEIGMNDIAASFQYAVVRALIKNTNKALENYKVNSISLVGGVAANSEIRKSFIDLAQAKSKKIVIPRLEFCGDNAAMIAFRGQKLFETGKKYENDYAPFPALPEDLYSVL